MTRTKYTNPIVWLILQIISYNNCVHIETYCNKLIIRNSFNTIPFIFSPITITNNVSRENEAKPRVHL